MNKSKVLLMIAKLLGIALILTITLATTSLIELLQILQQAIAKLKPTPQPELLLSGAIESEKVELRSAIASHEPSHGKIELPDITHFLPKYRSLINQLPRDYLTVKMLKKWSKEIGIKGYSKMLKSQLVQVHSFNNLRGNYATKTLGIA